MSPGMDSTYCLYYTSIVSLFSLKMCSSSHMEQLLPKEPVQFTFLKNFLRNILKLCDLLWPILTTHLGDDSAARLKRYLWLQPMERASPPFPVGSTEGLPFLSVIFCPTSYGMTFAAFLSTSWSRAHMPSDNSPGPSPNHKQTSEETISRVKKQQPGAEKVWKQLQWLM